MFLKVPEGFQRKKFSSCPETLLLPYVDMMYAIHIISVLPVVLVEPLEGPHALRAAVRPHDPAGDGGLAQEVPHVGRGVPALVEILRPHGHVSAAQCAA